MKMKPGKSVSYLFLVIAVIIINSAGIMAEDNSSDTSNGVPITVVFHHLDKNFINQFGFNYGANYVAACLGTWGIVESGFDWRWRMKSLEDKSLSNAGRISVEGGMIIPLIVPIGLYLGGEIWDNDKLAITGLALGQAAILGVASSSLIKAITGREGPEIRSRNNTDRPDFSRNFRFGILRGGAYQGWPSSNTAVAFAMGTTLMELYPDNLWIKVGSLTYATLIGAGVTTSIHWASDAFAGVLIGWAIGSTVGKDFRELMNPGERNDSNLTYQITPYGIRICYRF